jgi:hypothetical protein
MAEPQNLAHENPQPLQAAAAAVHPGRLGAYAVLGASVSVVPIPWVPEALARRVRGSLVHDIAVRHGVSLAAEARALLADPSGPDAPRGIVSQALRFFGIRLAARMLTRLGPVAIVWPVQNALRTFVLGRLFARYLERARTVRAVRVDMDEARRVRRAIDGALARAMTVPVTPIEEPTVIDDQRDPTTALVDGLLGVVAGAPELLLRRLDAAFDDLIAHPDA